MKIVYINSPLSFSPLHGGVVCKLRKQAKYDAKAGIIHHNNKKDLGVPISWLFIQVPIETYNEVDIIIWRE